MRTLRPPCYECKKKPARSNSWFCTQKCAASWAETHFSGCMTEVHVCQDGTWKHNPVEACDDCQKVALHGV